MRITVVVVGFARRSRTVGSDAGITTVFEGTGVSLDLVGLELDDAPVGRALPGAEEHLVVVGVFVVCLFTRPVAAFGVSCGSLVALVH
ncbi:MAG TPA: hypothetical protein VFW55_08125, partial [Propionicimonas sp.]|nr:hypothetical protein [Propionicimonas sp.]